MKFGAVMMAGTFAVAAAAVCGASEIARYDSRMVVSESVMAGYCASGLSFSALPRLLPS